MTNRRDRVWSWIEHSPRAADTALTSAGIALTVLVMHLVLGGTEVLTLVCTLVTALPLYARTAAPVTAFVVFGVLSAACLLLFGVAVMALAFWAVPCLMYGVAAHRSRRVAGVVLATATTGCLVMGLMVGRWYLASSEQGTDAGQWPFVLLVFSLAGALFPVLGHATGTLVAEETRLEHANGTCLPAARA